MIQADAKKRLAEQNAKKKAEAIIAEAKAYSEGKRAETDAKASNRTHTVNSRLQVAQLRSDGVIKEADAELENANNLQ